MLKLKFFCTVSELVILVFALNVLYDHIHQAWLNQSNGFWNAVGYQWHIARYPMLVAIIIIVLIFLLDGFVLYWENKKEAEKGARLDAVLFLIAKASGFTEIEIQEAVLNAKAKKKHK